VRKGITRKQGFSGGDGWHSSRVTRVCVDVWHGHIFNLEAAREMRHVARDDTGSISGHEPFMGVDFGGSASRKWVKLTQICSISEVLFVDSGGL
jgi:hypothetical protein